LRLLVVALTLVASGCGSKKTTATAASTTPAPSSSFKVGLNTDTGGLNDRGFNHLAYVGLQRAAKDLGANVRVTQSKSTSDYIPNLSALARQGYDLVIGVGFTENPGDRGRRKAVSENALRDRRRLECR